MIFPLHVLRPTVLHGWPARDLSNNDDVAVNSWRGLLMELLLLIFRRKTQYLGNTLYNTNDQPIYIMLLLLVVVVLLLI